jgi:catechol 2,3-dioxygenase-like lactoylglutathione lyase family enzyme
MTTPQKVHVALNVSDVNSSVQFYRAMFGLEPVKLKSGYAKFDISEPPLNLTLNYDSQLKGRGALNHLGVEVASTEEVLAARERLQKAGLATLDEMNVDCCFALQDKTWITDPDGYRWEIFTIKIPDTQPNVTNEQPQNSMGSKPCCST